MKCGRPGRPGTTWMGISYLLQDVQMSRATAQQVARASALGCLRRTLINRSSRSSRSSLRFCRSDFLQPSRPSNSSRGRPGRPGVGLAQPSSGLPEVVLSMGRSYACQCGGRMKGDLTICGSSLAGRSIARIDRRSRRLQQGHLPCGPTYVPDIFAGAYLRCRPVGDLSDGYCVTKAERFWAWANHGKFIPGR